MGSRSPSQLRWRRNAACRRKLWLLAHPSDRHTVGSDEHPHVPEVPHVPDAREDPVPEAPQVQHADHDAVCLNVPGDSEPEVCDAPTADFSSVKIFKPCITSVISPVPLTMTVLAMVVVLFLYM